MKSNTPELIDFENMVEHQLYHYFHTYINGGLNVPNIHLQQIKKMSPESAQTLWHSQLQYAIPSTWSERSRLYPYEMSIRHDDMVWSEENVSKIRQQIHNLGVSYDTKVYFITSPDDIIQTTWKIIVLYWYIFDEVRCYCAEITDASQQWLCSFHHERVITMSSRNLRGNLKRLAIQGAEK